MCATYKNKNLTPLEPAEFHSKRYNLPILAKSLEFHNSPVKCARELFKPPKDLASLLVCNEKKILGLFFLWATS